MRELENIKMAKKKTKIKTSKKAIEDSRLIPNQNEVIVRMYRQGLGDCFLLALPTKEDQTKYVLIDCGIHMRQTEGRKRLLEVSENICRATNNHLHVVVPTHEHADHLVGFVQKGSPFLKHDNVKIDEVWFAWTEKFGDPQADQLRANRAIARSVVEEAVKKMRTNINLEEMAARIDNALGFEMMDSPKSSEKTVDESSLSKKLKKLSEENPMKSAIYTSFNNYFENQYSFLGAAAAGSKPRRPSSNEKALCLLSLLGDPKYHEPGDTITLENVADIQVYVLGPPRTSKLLNKDSPSKVRGGDKHEYKETYLDGSSSSIAFGLSPSLNVKTGVAEKLRFPFPEGHGLPPNKVSFYKDKYKNSKKWRGIDHDWLGSTESLALHLDGDTNNTSLVLAFELGEPGSGSVLLFTADAQVGNWLSWRDQDYGHRGEKISADDLMRRTDLYKVGHHGSHNGTIRNDPRENPDQGGSPFGLELMNDIIAMIPVHYDAVRKNMPHPWRMPHKPMYDKLREKSGRRVLRSDDSIKPLHTSEPADLVPSSSEWEAVPGKKNCKWRKSEEVFTHGTETNSADEPLYYDVSFPIK